MLQYLWGCVRFALIKLRRQQREVWLADNSDSDPLPSTTGGETVVERGLDARGLVERIR